MNNEVFIKIFTPVSYESTTNFHLDNFKFSITYNCIKKYFELYFRICDIKKFKNSIIRHVQAISLIRNKTLNINREIKNFKFTNCCHNQVVKLKIKQNSK